TSPWRVTRGLPGGSPQTLFPTDRIKRASHPQRLLLNERSFSMIARLVRSPEKSGEERMMRIEKAAVLGAGTMGAQIAAHLATAGVPTLLLDIPPRELTTDEQAKGLTFESRQVRNRIAQAGLDAAKKAKPAAFFTPETASLVTVGNFDDDLQKLKDCDLI